MRERKEMEDFLANSTDPLVYGIHTGFGPHAFLSNESIEKVQKSLVYHLTVEKVFDSVGNPKIYNLLCIAINKINELPYVIYLVCF